MKKLCLVLGLAGLLSMPSIVFGEATWYGSFRGGVESAGGSSHMFSNGSRWGVRGSNEISEGLTANYRYEEALDLATASLATGNRLSYVGLSGGFGTISIGRIWSASFNTVGAILDNSWVYGSSHTSYRVGPAVSYSNSAGAATLQVDLVMDGSNAAKSGVDAYEFGLSFDLGAATLAFAHRKRNLAAVTERNFVEGTAGTPTQVSVVHGMPGTPTQVTVVDGMPGTPTQVTVVDGTAGTAGTAGTPTVVTFDPAEPEVKARDGIFSEAQYGVRYEMNADGVYAAVDPILDDSDAAITDQEECEEAGGAIIFSGNCYRAGDYVEYGFVEAGSATGTLPGETGYEKATPISAGITEAACTQAGATNVWLNGKCYPAGSVAIYGIVAPIEGKAAKPLTVTGVTPGEAGTDGEAGTPTQVTVVDGTAGTPTQVTVVDGTTGTVTRVEVEEGEPGTPSRFVTTTTTPAHDDTMNAVAVRFAAGSHSAAVGLVKTSNSMGGESSTTIANAGGPLSDGLSYNFMVRDTEGSGSNPWVIGLAKSLGGGSTVVLEHGDAGDENSTAVYLQVDF